jgi:hypothetical protein
MQGQNPYRDTPHFASEAVVRARIRVTIQSHKIYLALPRERPLKRGMNKNNHTTARPVADLVSKFLGLAPTKPDFDCRGPAKSTTLKIAEHGITYTFTPAETETLKTLSEVTGVPLDWFANDAVNWTRGYIADLTRRGTGQLFDLIDIDDGSPCPVRKEHQARTREFVAAIDREWKRQWSTTKAAA